MTLSSNKTKATILFLVLLLSACTNSPVQTPAYTPVVLPSETATTVPSATFTTARSLDFTPTASMTLSPTLTATATARPCPDPWFKETASSIPPIFLLIFSGLYVAYHFDRSVADQFYVFPREPAVSWAISFSQDQSSIAYYLPKATSHLPKGFSSTPGLWVSDVKLCHPLLFYTDPDGRIDAATSRAYFQWGPGDKSLIFRSSENEFPMVIYQLESQKIERWQGACEDVRYLAETREVVVGCAHDGSYSYLHPDGRITTKTDIPKPTGDPVVAWSFSKEGDAVYITSSRAVYLLRRNGQKIRLPLKGFIPIDEFEPVPLQRAANRNRFLVLAYDLQANRCLYEKACWFVIDGESGKITWWLRPEIINQVSHWIEQTTMGPASLSPDGELIAVQYFWGLMRDLLIIRLSTNEIVNADDRWGDMMAWPAP